MWKVLVTTLVVLHLMLSLLSTSKAFFSGGLKSKQHWTAFSRSFPKQHLAPIMPTARYSSESTSAVCMSTRKNSRQQENSLYQEVVEKMLYDNPRAAAASGSVTPKSTSLSKKIQYGKPRSIRNRYIS